MEALMIPFLVLFEILKIVGPGLLVIFVVLALACYGISLVRLFFKI